MSQHDYIILSSDPQLALRWDEVTQPNARCTAVWNLDELDEALATEPQLVLVDARADRPAALLAARCARDAGATVLLLGPAERRLMLEGLRVGCQDVLHPLHPEQLATFLEMIDRRDLGVLYAVIGAHGGSGVTTVSIALASFLARDERVALVDLDVMDRGLASALGLQPGFTARDLVRSTGKIDEKRLRAAMTRTQGGFWILPQEEDIFDEPAVEPEELPSLIAALRHAYDHIVIDLGSGFDELMQRVAFDASHVVLLTTQDRPCLQTAKLRVSQLREVGLQDDQMHVVVNQFNASSGPGVDVISDMLEIEVALTVADDPVTAGHALNRGLPTPQVAPDAELVHDVDDLARRLLGQPPVPERRSAPGGRSASWVC
ncbi:MAG: hypothetical protein GY913_12955 [Proteobacteria bacterium]|nr:hypothetical protein [Pseudomonadota bacterium]MCP4917816.1 hypothetical protein [Pseudomonadota bacterium]